MSSDVLYVLLVANTKSHVMTLIQLAGTFQVGCAPEGLLSNHRNNHYAKNRRTSNGKRPLSWFLSKFLTTNQPNREAIERAPPAAGLLFIRAIASTQDITQGAINKRAKGEWMRARPKREDSGEG